MRAEESHTDLGAIKIHKNVIASISALASVEIQGVKKIGGDFKTAFMELLGKKTSGGIEVDINKNEEVKVKIPIIIEYGFNIPEVAAKVQENVRQALEKMTTLSIRDIDINVQGIEKKLTTKEVK